MTYARLSTERSESICCFLLKTNKSRSLALLGMTIVGASFISLLG
jgi:hypothetical protein